MNASGASARSGGNQAASSTIPPPLSVHELLTRYDNIDPLEASRAVTNKTRAIIVPHLFGLPADLTEERLGIPLIENCAPA